MPSPEVEACVEAFADAVIPSPPSDPTAGAADVAAQRFVLHYLEFLQQGLSEVLSASLDGAAAARQGVPFGPGLFSALDADGRLDVIAVLGRHESQDVRDLIDLSCALVFAAFYGEWTGQDESGVLSRKPVGWTLCRHDGPARSVPGLLKKPAV